MSCASHWFNLIFDDLARTPWVEAYLCLSLAFDAVAFLVILFATAKAMQTYQIGRIMKVIRQDGIMYFFVLFSSNLVWLLLLLHARVSHAPLSLCEAVSTMMLRSRDWNSCTISEFSRSTRWKKSHSNDIISGRQWCTPLSSYAL